MSTTTLADGGAPLRTLDTDQTRALPSLYYLIWRWHFYAGLISLPFMVILAITGGIYLFKDEINGWLHRDLLWVEAPADKTAAPLPHQALMAAALEAIAGGEATGYRPPREAGASAMVRIDSPQAGARQVFVHPWSGEVLGDVADGGSAGSGLLNLVRDIHSLDVLGWIPNRMIELVGGWTVILTLSGIYLWWPRRRMAGGPGALTIRRGVGRRPFWRDLHAVTGLFTGAFLVFLAVSGLPWSGFWGSQFGAYADAQGWGYPPQYWNVVPESQPGGAHDHHSEAADAAAPTMGESLTHAPWAAERLPMPSSTPGAVAPIGLDAAVARFAALGVPAGTIIDLPAGETGVYSISVFPDRARDQRVIHLDQYSGEPLFDGGWQDLGGYGRAIEWGISLHMGQEFGLANQLLLLAVCLATLAMSVAAAVMWWKRRPPGRLGIPPLPTARAVPVVILVLAVVIGVIYPLVGASIVLMLLLDRWWLHRRPA